MQLGGSRGAGVDILLGHARGGSLLIELAIDVGKLLNRTAALMLRARKGAAHLG